MRRSTPGLWILRGAALAALCMVRPAVAPLSASDTHPLLTLREAVLIALAENERMIGSLENITQAQLGRTLAGSAFATRITPNLLGSFGQSDVRNQTYGGIRLAVALLSD